MLRLGGVRVNRPDHPAHRVVAVRRDLVRQCRSCAGLVGGCLSDELVEAVVGEVGGSFEGAAAFVFHQSNPAAGQVVVGAGLDTARHRAGRPDLPVEAVIVEQGGQAGRSGSGLRGDPVVAVVCERECPQAQAVEHLPLSAAAISGVVFIRVVTRRIGHNIQAAKRIVGGVRRNRCSRVIVVCLAILHASIGVVLDIDHSVRGDRWRRGPAGRVGEHGTPCLTTGIVMREHRGELGHVDGVAFRFSQQVSARVVLANGVVARGIGEEDGAAEGVELRQGRSGGAGRQPHRLARRVSALIANEVCLTTFGIEDMLDP